MKPHGYIGLSAGIRAFSVCLAVIFIGGSSLSLMGQPNNSTKSELDVWQRIAAYFSPPENLRDKFGDYKSVFTFNDGSSVRSAADWLRRREEIRANWHGLMGSWPPLIRDNNIVVLDSVVKPGYVQYTIRFDWIPGKDTEAYLLVPDGGGKKPAVLTVYYEPETAVGLGKDQRDFAYQLAKRGFVTLSIGAKEALAAREFSIFYPSVENATIQPLSMLAYAAANAWHILASVSEVDSARIGIMGHSFGGKWAMFASCLFDKFACGVWSDPGIVFDTNPMVGYWEPWYLGYHPKPWRTRGKITGDSPAKGLYVQLIEQGYDLHELHALMAPRPFLVSGGSTDPVSRWVPLNHSIEVNRLLGYRNRVAMTNRPKHAPDSTSNEQIYLFLEYFLKYDNKG